MGNGFVFGENNSSFVYDNRFDQLLSALERLADIQKDTLEEIKCLRGDIRDLEATWREYGRDRRY